MDVSIIVQVRSNRATPLLPGSVPVFISTWEGGFQSESESESEDVGGCSSRVRDEVDSLHMISISSARFLPSRSLRGTIFLDVIIAREVEGEEDSAEES